jgi:FkbM family methyltransferase
MNQLKILNKNLAILNLGNKLLYMSSLPVIAYKRFMLKEYLYWIKLPFNIKTKHNLRIQYLGDLLTLSKVQENENFLKIILNKKYKYLLDIGGQTGRISHIFAISRKEYKIVYFEPNINSFDLFKKIVDKEGLNIDCLNIGVSNKKGTLKFNLSSKFGGSSTFEKLINPYKVKEVNVNSLDNLIKDNKIKIPKKIDLIKIDVEGHETKVLEGMVNFLKHNNVDMLLELFSKDKFKNFVNQLERFNINFTIKRIGKYDYFLRIKKEN